MPINLIVCATSPWCGSRDVDWTLWQGKLEHSLGPEGVFADLFAVGALFSDPVNAPTMDLAAIEEMTEASFPDWRQEINWVHGDDTAGAFEWIGRGTLGGSIPIEIHGCTVVDVDASGLVTRWRDYFDLSEIDRQVAEAGAATSPAPPTS
jgi:SnoaL-like domain